MSCNYIFTGSQYEHIKKWNAVVSNHQAFKLGIDESKLAQVCISISLLIEIA